MSIHLSGMSIQRAPWWWALQASVILGFLLLAVTRHGGVEPRQLALLVTAMLAVALQQVRMSSWPRWLKGVAGGCVAWMSALCVLYACGLDYYAIAGIVAAAVAIDGWLSTGHAREAAHLDS